MQKIPHGPALTRDTVSKQIYQVMLLIFHQALLALEQIFGESYVWNTVADPCHFLGIRFRILIFNGTGTDPESES